MTEDIPPVDDPRAWLDSDISLPGRGPDGNLSGQINIGGARWWIRGWRKGEAPGAIVLQTQPVSDEVFEAFAKHVTRKIQG